MSVAQYDALLVAAYYQDKFKATTPSVSADKKPSYPSEEAAALMSTLTALKSFFPAETTYIDERGATIRQTLLQNKKYVMSDIVAGEQIGQQVAEKALARAQSDGMREAQSRSKIENDNDYAMGRPRIYGNTRWTLERYCLRLNRQTKPNFIGTSPHFSASQSGDDGRNYCVLGSQDVLYVSPSFASG